MKDEKSFIAAELWCVRTAARPHPSVREGRMNWGLENKRPEYATSLNTENTAEKFRTKDLL